MHYESTSAKNYVYMGNESIGIFSMKNGSTRRKKCA